MSAVWILAQNTYREAVRDRLLATVLAFGAILVLASLVLAPLTLGEQDRVVRDLGLSAVSLFTTILIVLVGTGMVWREIERRTIHTILTQPVTRAQFLVGKFLGLYASVLVSVAALGATWITVVGLFGGGLAPGLFAAVALAALEALVVTAIAIFFSSVASPLLSAVFTVMVVVAGHAAGDLRTLAEGSGNFALAGTIRAFEWVLPALHQFDVRNAIMAGLPVPGAQIAACAGYSVLYAIGVLVVTVVAFGRRDFE